MPFRSKAQQRFMFAKHPGIAKRWANEYGTDGNLPERVARGNAYKKMKKSGRLRSK